MRNVKLCLLFGATAVVLMLTACRSGDDSDTSAPSTTSSVDQEPGDEEPVSSGGEKGSQGAEDQAELDNHPSASAATEGDVRDSWKRAGGGGDTSAPDIANRVPTIEQWLRASNVLIEAQQRSENPSRWFDANASGAVARMDVFDQTDILGYAATPAPQSPILSLMLASREACGDLPDGSTFEVCTQVAEDDIPLWPATPFPFSAQGLAAPGISESQRFNPEQTATGTEVLVGWVGTYDVNGDVELWFPALDGGPDYNRTIAKDQLVFAFKKAAAYEHLGYPFWYNNTTCESGDIGVDLENPDDSGLEEFLSDYTEGAGATVTDADFPPPQDRIDRYQAYLDACDARRQELDEEYEQNIADEEAGWIVNDSPSGLFPPLTPEQSVGCGNRKVDLLPAGASAAPACPSPGTWTP